MDLFQQSVFDENFDKGDSYATVSLFLKYAKTKKNPIGDPIPKQGDRSTIRFKANPDMQMVNGKKYYTRDSVYVGHYPDPEVVKNADLLNKQAIEKCSGLGYLPFDKKISIERLVFVFAPLKSFTKKQKDYISSGGFLYKDKKPDEDNLKKLLYDALEGVIMINDSRICRTKEFYKVYGNTPGVYIIIKGEL